MTKIIVKAICIQLTEYLNANNILPQKQLDFQINEHNPVKAIEGKCIEQICEARNLGILIGAELKF